MASRKKTAEAVATESVEKIGLHNLVPAPGSHREFKAWFDGLPNADLSALHYQGGADIRKRIESDLGKDAAAYAEQNKATELEYYDIVCAPTLGQIP